MLKSVLSACYFNRKEHNGFSQRETKVVSSAKINL